MSMSLVLTLIGIATLDSLNPSLFFAQFYLLTTYKPVMRIVTYILGVLVANFTGGWLILNGARTIITDVFASIDPSVLTLIQIVIGVIILIYGLCYHAAPTKENVTTPRSLHPLYTFGFGALVMVNELTTALPYFVAIEQIGQAKLSGLVSFLALLLYNIVFALPLFGFLGLFLLLRKRFNLWIERITIWSKRWIPVIIKWVAVALGAVLIIDGLF